jgi:hypothetical protein
MTKLIVCLANSRKNNGHCVAGIEFVSGAAGSWIRPVSARASRELTWAERAYKGMVDPAILDLVAVPLAGPLPEGHQIENHVIEKGTLWERQGAITHADLEPFADRPERLWINGLSSRAGKNDRVDETMIDRLRGSLHLLHLPRLVVRVGVPAVTHGRAKRKVYVDFSFGGEEYSLPMTDPHVETEYLARNNGNYVVEDAYVTVSLSEPFAGYCYKLAASLIVP